MHFHNLPNYQNRYSDLHLAEYALRNDIIADIAMFCGGQTIKLSHHVSYYPDSGTHLSHIASVRKDDVTEAKPAMDGSVITSSYNRLDTGTLMDIYAELVKTLS